MSARILAEFDETPESTLELAWHNWVTPSAVDKALDDAQGWAERVTGAAHHEIRRMESRQAIHVDFCMRVPAEDEDDALGRGELRVFYTAALEMANDNLDLAERVAARVTASGDSSLRRALEDENEEWLLSLMS
jgi:hypothetical protein